MKKVMIFPFIYIIALLILGTLHLIWPDTLSLSLIKVTEIGLSWPVLLVIFLCYFICVYYDPIYNYLDEMTFFKTPYVEISRQKKATETNNSKNKMAYENIIKALFEERKEYIDKTTEKDTKIKFLEKNAVDWMFLYASIFLVPKTKAILGKICDLSSIDMELLHGHFASMKIGKQESNNIFNALISLNFISIEKTSVNITPLGKYYVEYMKSTKQL